MVFRPQPLEDTVQAAPKRVLSQFEGFRAQSVRSRCLASAEVGDCRYNLPFRYEAVETPLRGGKSSHFCEGLALAHSAEQSLAVLGICGRLDRCFRGSP